MLSNIYGTKRLMENCKKLNFFKNQECKVKVPFFQFENKNGDKAGTTKLYVPIRPCLILHSY